MSRTDAAGETRGDRPRVLYWRETTDGQPFETGIQRVTRRLAAGLARQGAEVVPVGWDPVRRSIRTGSARPGPGSADWLLLPEIPLGVLAEDLDPVQLARAYGLRAAAVVHDLIPVRLAELYGARERRLYARYFRLFAGADLVLATTELVAGHLREHLAGANLRQPDIAVVPLPAQFGDRRRVTAPPAPRSAGEPLRLLTVSTWEPRKNLSVLLRAVRLARRRCGTPVDLTLVGRREDHPDHDAEIGALLADLPGCGAPSRVDDAALAALSADSHASVYPSREEGFGLPVLESLWLGRPCLCHSGSAMAEVAPGGGTLTVDMGDADAVAEALVRMAEEPDLLPRLTAEAMARPLRDWDDYARGVAGALGPARGVARSGAASAARTASASGPPA